MFFQEKLVYIVLGLALVGLMFWLFRRSPWLIVIPVVMVELVLRVLPRAKVKNNEQRQKEDKHSEDLIKRWKRKLADTQQIIKKLKDKKQRRKDVKENLDNVPDSERAGNFNDEWGRRHPGGTADPNGSKT